MSREGRSAPALASALVVSASLLGDTFLYTVLPVQASSLGISRPTVGVLLSVNRWVRLFTNPLAARIYERWPAGTVVLVAIVLTAISTAMYALPALLWVFIAGRLLWGFCFSLLRLGSFLSALEDATAHAGRRIGNLRAVWGIGYFGGAIFVAAGGFRIDEQFHLGAPILGALVPATFVAAAFALTQRIAQVLWTPIAGRLGDRSATVAFAVSTAVAIVCVAALALPLDQ